MPVVSAERGTCMDLGFGRLASFPRRGILHRSWGGVGGAMMMIQVALYSCSSAKHGTLSIDVGVGDRR